MSFDTWYREIPIVTRCYLTASVLTTVACFFDLVSPFSLYLNYRLIWEKYEVWRLFTNFFFFGMPSLDFGFHMYFLVRYCRLLEEGPSFRGRSADFFTMLLFGAVLMLVMAPFSSVFFLGYSLTFMMVYVWGRRNETFPMNFLGLFNFPAPWLPWVLLAFSALLGASPVVDLVGILVGHVYYYLQDIVPRMPGRFHGRRFIFTPALIQYLFDERQHDGLRVEFQAGDAGAGNELRAEVNARAAGGDEWGGAGQGGAEGDDAEGWEMLGEEGADRAVENPGEAEGEASWARERPGERPHLD